MHQRADVPTWDETFMRFAQVAAGRSKDPRTQVGACIVSQDRRILSIGYNGTPRGFSDQDFPWGRDSKDPLETKYPFVVHAERNAILNFRGSLRELEGAVLYVTHSCCNECAKEIAQVGVSEVVFRSEHSMAGGADLAASAIFRHAGVRVRQMKEKAERMDLTEMVKEFYHKFNQDSYLASGPADLQGVDPARLDLKVGLIVEELCELVEAVYSQNAAHRLQEAWQQVLKDSGPRSLDVVAAADATGDLRYVIEGFDLEAGIPTAAVLEEIHASNMSKLGDDGRPVISDGTTGRPVGKILKGPRFFEPDLESVVAGRAPDRTPLADKEEAR